MRADLELIYDWVPQGAHVLDLACGDGALLERLAQEKNVTGYGLEIDPDGITQCVARGVNVIEHNLDDGLGSFCDNSYDQVIMTQALQALRRRIKCLMKCYASPRKALSPFLILLIGDTEFILAYVAICRSLNRYPMPGMTHPTSIFLPLTTSSICAVKKGW